ncbi:hypothetical protein ACH4ND_20590 [Streptomyces sp. NPDC017179]|uniref:hypothetical protein n=1 Tax=Streptomyces sp. NPDC017179 TaxID=3364979 RepID=UPI0037B0EF80
MINVKSLVTRANPVPDAASDELSARASEDLAALVGSTPVTQRGVRKRRTPRGVSRRGALVASVACAAVAVVAGVTFFALDSPEEPGGGGPLADEPYFETTAKLENAADLIVRVRLGAGHEESVDGIDETVATARVTATAKGDESSGRSIEVVYTTPGSGPETADLAEGKEYVLLLDTMGGGRFTLVNTTQGAYRVEDGQAVASGGNDIALSPGVTKALRLTS